MSITLFSGREGSRKALIAEAKEQSKLTALFTPFGMREARNMNLLDIRQVFGRYAAWFVMMVRQEKISV